jgi:hypothetical protein
LSTLYMTRIGLIDPSQELQQKFANTYLDHKRDAESAVVYELFKQGNAHIASIHARIVDNIINEQMHLKRITALT